ncbi:MAG: hypothetical protein HY481_01175 [Candidatus Vogelbacteria bacterium]|nr:hypothetical protein [Candidatus Vogelbacteria bacterium]
MADYTLADEIDEVTAGGYALQKCPQPFCHGVIDMDEQRRHGCSAIFFCPECDRRAFVQNNGQLATEEEYAKEQVAMCET